jgi:hypothetical protein
VLHALCRQLPGVAAGGVGRESVVGETTRQADAGWGKVIEGDDMMILGIDPGQSGGLAFIDFDSRQCHLYPMPLRGSRVDVYTLQDLIIQHAPQRAYLEAQRVKGNQRGQALIMLNQGRLEATLELCDVGYSLLDPKVWQKAINVSGDKNEHIDHAAAYCQIPTLKPNGRKLHDGIADAVCIAVAGEELRVVEED